MAKKIFTFYLPHILIGSAFILGLSLIPLPGVNNSSSLVLNGTSFQVEMLDQNQLNRVAWGTHDMMTHDVEIATGNQGVYHFLSVCSHELQHVEYDLEDEYREDSLTTEEEHELMKGISDPWLPWNWKTGCFKLLPERMSFLTLN